MHTHASANGHTHTHRDERVVSEKSDFVFVGSLLTAPTLDLSTEAKITSWCERRKKKSREKRCFWGALSACFWVGSAREREGAKRSPLSLSSSHTRTQPMMGEEAH